MATLVLGLAGQAFGGPIGGALGALAGGFIDRAMFGGGPTKQKGPRLTDLKFQASTAGAPIPRVWGKMRVETQVIWATAFKETQKTETSGGKGGGGGTVETTTFSYSVSFALGLCAGEIAGIGKIWLDGKLGRLADYTARLYLGTKTQAPDPKILAVEGAEATPAFRDTAYLVFEDMPLEAFGNRVPQVTVEVIRRPPPSGPVLEDLMRGVTMIPGTTEFGYATTQVSVVTGVNETTPDNSHASGDVTDLVIALDRLQDEAPAVDTVALVVAWHGTDLRAGACEIRPKVESAGRTTKPFSWAVGPVTRSGAQVVSQFAGAPAAGGAPSDRSVYEGIKELKRRGLKVTLYPFVLMDIPAGNGLTDPYGGAEQAAYPWRGRITCSPAPGRPGSPDKSAAAATEVTSFFGACTAAQFGWNAGSLTVSYSGPAEWGLRRLVLHLATIGAAAGGVDNFLIGSELVGLTTVRSSASAYPAVTRLVSLAAQARIVLGAGTKIGYAADWSEYHSHRPADGSGDVFFNLDPLWADGNIDFVGVDNYLPIADWRDGLAHLDALAGFTSIIDPAYLAAGIEGGEDFDWYYASQAARDAQTRTPIADAAYAKPWVFRNKDLRSWWLNAHKNRPGGVESAAATAWTPQSKPIVFTELGCPAVDKAANQPNVFVDPKSSESHLPYYSNGRRDEAIQRATLEAWLAYWEPAAGHNPISTVYAGRMIDTTRTHLWTWDARPYPEFPQRSEIWADAANWRLGHWLTGRLGLVQLRDVAADIGSGLGVAVDASALFGLVWGYLSDQVASPRDDLGPLMRAFFFDASQSGATLRFRHRGGGVARSFARADLVARPDARGFSLTRGQESELPREIDLSFYLPEADYRQGSVPSRRLIGSTGAILQEGLPIALPASRAAGIADALLIQAHVERERAAFTLPPSALDLDSGDVVQLDSGTRTFRLRIEEAGLDPTRPVQSLREAPEVYDLEDGPDLDFSLPRAKPPAPPLLYLMDLPLLRDEDAATAHAPRAAATGSPWQPVAIYRAPSAAQSLKRDSTVENPAIIGQLAQSLFSGPLWRWDRVNALEVAIPAGVALASADELDVFAGANAAAVQSPSGRWEVLQWRDATLVAPRTYRLTTLLRGQRGSEAEMAAEVLAGASFVVLDADAVIATGLPASLARSEQYWSWGPAKRPPSDPLFQSATLTFEAIGLRPLAPVQLRAVRDADSGDVTLTWIRRSRIGGDAWEQTEIPLGEEREAYAVAIYDGATLVRSVELTAPLWVYTAPDQASDFGGLATDFTIGIAQLSAAFGAGVALQETVHV